MGDDQRLADIKRRVQHFEDQRALARSRLAEATGRFWYFALVGFRAESDRIEFPPLAFIQRVTEPPGEVALAGALKHAGMFSAIGRYAPHVTHELAVNRELGFDDEACFALAYHLAGALRVKSLAEFLVPAVSDHSWSTIAALDDQSCEVKLLEDIPSAQRLRPATTVAADDAKWVEENFARYLGLATNDKFVLASEALTSQHLVHSKRLMAASLWAGIEALFEIQSELRFRIAAQVAAVLEPRGPMRLDLYKQVQKLYDVRSKAVHGSALTEAAITEHVQQVRLLLAQLLRRFIEAEAIPTREHLEERLFF